MNFPAATLLTPDEGQRAVRYLGHRGGSGAQQCLRVGRGSGTGPCGSAAGCRRCRGRLAALATAGQRQNRDGNDNRMNPGAIPQISHRRMVPRPSAARFRCSETRPDTSTRTTLPDTQYPTRRTVGWRGRRSGASGCGRKDFPLVGCAWMISTSRVDALRELCGVDRCGSQPLRPLRRKGATGRETPRKSRSSG